MCAQLMGKFYIYDEKLGHYNMSDIDINAIDVQTLDGCLVVFRCNGEHATNTLMDMINTSGVWDEIEASIMVVNNDLIAGIDVIDISEADKMTFRSLNPEIEEKIERRAARQEMRKNLDAVIFEDENLEDDG